MKEEKKHVSMQDVAEMANVSKSTVSKVLNNKEGVSEEVKKRVLECCEELGYKLNWNIQDLIRINKTQKSQNIAFIMCGLEFADPAYSRFLDGIAASARDYNFQVVLTKLTGKEEKIFDLPPILRDRRIDGILISGYLNENIVQLLKKLELPFIILGNYQNSLIREAISVEIDLSAVMNEIVAVLHRENKRAPLFFDEMFEIHFTKTALECYKKALHDHGMSFSQDLCVKGDGPYSSSCPFFKKALASVKSRFDSVVCIDFRSAQHLAYYFMSEYGYKGADGIWIATARLYDYYQLPLPGIYVNPLFDEIAYDGMKILVDIINGHETLRPRKLVLKPEIEVVRDPDEKPHIRQL